MVGDTPLPLPEDREIPFVSSFQGTAGKSHFPSTSLTNNLRSSALESFMKFDKKYTKVVIHT